MCGARDLRKFVVCTSDFAGGRVCARAGLVCVICGRRARRAPASGATDPPDHSAAAVPWPVPPGGNGIKSWWNGRASIATAASTIVITAVTVTATITVGGAASRWRSARSCCGVPFCRCCTVPAVSAVRSCQERRRRCRRSARTGPGRPPDGGTRTTPPPPRWRPGTVGRRPTCRTSRVRRGKSKCSSRTDTCRCSRTARWTVRPRIRAIMVSPPSCAYYIDVRWCRTCNSIEPRYKMYCYWWILKYDIEGM